MPFFSFLSARSWAVLGAVIVVSVLAWSGYFAIFSRGMVACETEHELADLHAAEEAHQTYLAEVARGDVLSAELIKTQRRLDETKTEYLAYANGITGNCPADLGLLVQSASTDSSLPKTSGTPTDASASIAAALIAANIGTNYPRCHACIAQLNALIDWHEHKETVK